jgi:hypothetical protein
LSDGCGYRTDVSSPISIGSTSAFIGSHEINTAGCPASTPWDPGGIIVQEATFHPVGGTYPYGFDESGQVPAVYPTIWYGKVQSRISVNRKSSWLGILVSVIITFSLYLNIYHIDI